MFIEKDLNRHPQDVSLSIVLSFVEKPESNNNAVKELGYL